MMLKQRTARFDYGEVENMKRYGTVSYFNAAK